MSQSVSAVRKDARVIVGARAGNVVPHCVLLRWTVDRCCEKLSNFSSLLLKLCFSWTSDGKKKLVKIRN